ncbi:MAG: KH domain-containing protein [Clostridia bacterium]|nr:KH domain-containing protein [Clostridia bacterium]
MKEIVEYIVKCLAQSPEEVEVEVITENNTEVVKVKVAASDMGRVIGKGGKLATSIRTIAKSLYQKQNKRVIIKIEEK